MRFKKPKPYKFAQESKTLKVCGRSGKMTSSCKWSIVWTINLVYQDPEIRGGGWWAVSKKLEKKFSSKNKVGAGVGGGDRPSGPSSGSATALLAREQAVWSHCYENDYFNSHANKMKLIFTRKVLHEALFWKWVFGFRKRSIEHLLHDSTCWHQSIYLLYF